MYPGRIIISVAYNRVWQRDHTDRGGGGGLQLGVFDCSADTSMQKRISTNEMRNI